MLRNKNIVVTGCSRGIGKAIVEVCAQYGANIFAVVRKNDDAFAAFCAELENKNNIKVSIFYADFSDENQVQNAADEILKLKVPVDGVVNNVGITGYGKLFSMTKMEEIKNTFQINFFSPILFTQKMLKNMIRNKKGSVVNISSIAAFDGNPAQLEYVSSKAAIIGATKKLCNELAPFGIRVNSVAPGMTETDMVTEMKDELKDATLATVAMKRLAKPSEIAETVAFLLSDKSSFVNGQTIRVDGGRS